MSHVAAVECAVTDLDVLRVAGERLGLEFAEGQRTHKWYGTWLNDWHSPRAASNKGVDPKTFGTCDHALRIKGAQPGARYEIGVTAQDNGTYRLVYDNYGQGHELERLAGVDLVNLRNEVAAETTERFAASRGYRVEREQTAQQIRLHLTR